MPPSGTSGSLRPSGRPTHRSRSGRGSRSTPASWVEQLAYTYEVIEYTPGEQVAMHTTQGPFPMDTTYTWRPVGDRVTHMTLRNHGGPNGLARLAAPLLTFAMRRAMRQDLDRLKQLLEARN